jgi:hypothetical protein
MSEIEETETIRNFDCYQCGKSNVGIYFCDEVCHQQWAEAHPMRTKSSHTIEEIQTKLKAMADKARSLKEERLKKFGGQALTSENTYEVAKLIFG